MTNQLYEVFACISHKEMEQKNLYFLKSLIGGRSTDRVPAMLQTNHNTPIALSIVTISDPNGK